MQDAAAQALRDGLARFDGGRGWRDTGLERRNSTAIGPAQLDRAPVGTGYPDWRKAVVLSKGDGEATIGFTNGSTGTLPASARVDAQARRRRRGVRLPEARHGHHRQADGAGSLCAALGSRGFGRHAGRGGPYRPRPCDAGRLRRRRLQLQPRDAGASPAWLGVQADRLCDCARERFHAGDDRASMRLSASGRARASARNASSISTAARRGRTPCAGVSSSHAT